jgi:catechol 2,3-dioxygenase-like lactoylglutathione lyase family enzyme
MSTPNPILGVNHVGIVAHDASALAGFYQRCAALQPWPALDALRLPGEGIALAGPNTGVRLLPGGAEPQRRPVSEAGFTHLCLQSPAIDTLHAAFAQAHASFHGPLVDLGTGFLYCYARDPEHNVVELEGVALVWGDPRPWIAHVNVACADIAAQCAFYGALFGAQAVRSPRLRDDARLDSIADLEGVELRMAWVDAGNLQVELINYTAPVAVATTAGSSRRLPGAAGHAYVALEVASLGAARAHLLACGGTLQDGPAPDGVALGADPEGNALWLLERDALDRHGAAFTRLPQPDITARFAAARARLQGPT